MVRAGLRAAEDGNDDTDALAASINADQSVYVTPSQVGDRHFIRVAVGQTWTTARDVDRLWEIVSAHLRRS